MRFGSVCSGIEAASVAWNPLGWRAAWFSEIEAFPSAVLAHHYPDVPNLGDMSTLPERIRCGEVEAPDVFCGGTPCQAFSVAGLRRSLDDARGNLSLTFCEIANAIDAVRLPRGKQPAVVFWENVPGVLNTKDNAFGCFLAGLAGEDDPLIPPGKKWSNAGAVYGPARAIAWRVLDAQYFGVAQRRRRVFVVASARTGFDPAAVLFESDGVRRDTAPSREAGQGTAVGTIRSTDGGSDVDHARAGHVITMAHGQGGAEIGFDRGPTLTCNHEAPIAAYCFSAKDHGADAQQDLAPTLRAGGHAGSHANAGVMPAIAFPANLSGTQCASAEDLPPAMGAKNPTGVAYTTKLHNTGSNNAGKIFKERTACLDANSPPPALLTAMQVRRLTPRECERLQGFPDDYTAIPWRKKPASECPDGPRYKALGNSWAVPNVRWIGQRIADFLDAEISALI